MINFSPKQFGLFKATLFLLALLPFLRLAIFAYADWLGANPSEFITRNTGDWTLYFLCFTLALSPVRRLTKWGQLLKLRRMLGLYIFFYATLHLMTFFWFDHFFNISEAVNDVIKRPFILVGIIVFVLLIPLTVTSTNSMVKRLGAKRWKWLHRLIYIIAPLVILHFWWMKAGKNDFFEPAMYGMVLATLLLMRVYWNAREARVEGRKTDLKQALTNLSYANASIKDISQVDPLTGAKNRTDFNERINLEWRRALRRQYPVGLLIVDIDHFKRINDIYGHLAGDECLKQVAKVIQENIRRPGDELFRSGGDEFVVILPDTDLNGATHLAKILATKVQMLPVKFNGKSVVVTVSVGAASMIPQSDINDDALMIAAESALTQAKDEGAGQVQAYLYSTGLGESKALPLHS